MIILKIKFAGLRKSWDFRRRKILETWRYYKSIIEFTFLITWIKSYYF